MKRSRKSRQVIKAQRLNALALSRSHARQVERQRFSVKLARRRVRHEVDAEMKAYQRKWLRHELKKLAALLAQPDEPAPQPAIVAPTLAELDAGRLALADAAKALGVHPAHLARRCRDELCKARLAVRVAVPGRPGPLRWYVASSLAGDQSKHIVGDGKEGSNAC